MKKPTTFEEILVQSDDQWLVRLLLTNYVPRVVKDTIVQQYQKEVDHRRQRAKYL